MLTRIISKVMVIGRLLQSASIGLLIGMWATVSVAEEVSIDQIKDLDGQVQDFKKDALRIAAEIGQLEKKLIYPSNTQTSLFVKLAQGDGLRLDAVAIKIDGKNATQYTYSAKELEALQHGGVQRIYTDNLRTGAHTLEVAIIGKSSNNSDYQNSANHSFAKSVGTKFIEITVSGSGSSIQAIDN